MDTCALSDMRALPAAAAAAGLPLTGPRAVTGLYSVDQMFPSCVAAPSVFRKQWHCTSLGNGVLQRR